MKKVVRIGETHKSNKGEVITILDYIDCYNCTIKFEDGTILKNVPYHNILKNTVKNPNCPHVYGVGYIGIGEYKSKNSGVENKNYKVWNSMIERCEDNKNKISHRTYKNCSVDLRWHSFQNFAEWFEQNYNPEIMEGWHLDKDILVKGNKVYSPETCCFVPNEINSLFRKVSKKSDTPVGVFKKERKFQTCINNKYLGLFDTPEKAFQTYKKAKEENIKEMAKLWKNKIFLKVYKAMLNYKIEIDD